MFVPRNAILIVSDYTLTYVDYLYLLMILDQLCR